MIFVSLLLLLVSVSALRVAPLPRHTRGVRRRLPAMDYHKVKAPTADEARAKNPTRNERPGLASKYEGVRPNERDTKKNKRNKIMKQKRYKRGGNPFDLSIHGEAERARHEEEQTQQDHEAEAVQTRGQPVRSQHPRGGAREDERAVRGRADRGDEGGHLPRALCRGDRPHLCARERVRLLLGRRALDRARVGALARPTRTSACTSP